MQTIYWPPFMSSPKLPDMRLIAVILSLCFSVTAEAKDAPTPCMPFAGEYMLFDAGWEFIRAGTADMRVETMGNSYRITSHGNSNHLLDIFHKVRDRTISEGVCRKDKLQSTLFDIVQNEGRYHSKKQVHFLWEKNTVTHTQNSKTDSYNVSAGHLNAIDAFFAVRKMKLSPGTTVHVPIFDSRKQYMLEVSILKTQQLMAPWGKSVECLVVEPKLKTKGIFSSKGKVKVWMTNDARHIPLKMVAKVKIGHIVARLRRYESARIE